MHDSHDHTHYDCHANYSLELYILDFWKPSGGSRELRNVSKGPIESHSRSNLEGVRGITGDPRLYLDVSRRFQGLSVVPESLRGVSDGLRGFQGVPECFILLQRPEIPFEITLKPFGS